MTLKRAEELANKLMNQVWKIDGINWTLDSGWTFGFNNAINRLGVCKWVQKRIELSKQFVLSNNEYTVEQTIRHEIAHALDSKIRGFSNHDNVWKNIAIQCGHTGERTGESNYDESVYKWLGECPNHGILGRWTRRPNDNKFCKKCSSKVQIFENKNYKRVRQS